MEREFQVERVTLHLVDRNDEEARLAKGEIDLAVFDTGESKTIRAFFNGHLNQVWNAREGRKTVAGSFRSDAMSQHYQAILDDPESFFERSCQIAQRLHEVSKKVRASTGLLMVVWFRVQGKQQAFLGLFKMDPGDTERIALQQDEAGNLLLDLAVERIRQTLPDPGDKLLKWAVIPHPIRSNFDVKAQDQQGGADPAEYFMEFLDCDSVASEKNQAKALIRTFDTYAREHHADEDWEPGVVSLLSELETESKITAEVVLEKVEEAGIFEGFQEGSFLETLEKHKAKELDISSSHFRAIRIEYRLENGIIIRGPRSVIENLVRIMPVDGESEFRIRSPGYKKYYV
jgi:nucleoid-associated protein YejK